MFCAEKSKSNTDDIMSDLEIHNSNTLLAKFVLLYLRSYYVLRMLLQMCWCFIS